MHGWHELGVCLCLLGVLPWIARRSFLTVLNAFSATAASRPLEDCTTIATPLVLRVEQHVVGGFVSRGTRESFSAPLSQR